MTFQELLAEVKKLSPEEKVQVLSVINDDLVMGSALSLVAHGEFEVWSPQVESLEPLQKALEQYKQTDGQ